VTKTGFIGHTSGAKPIISIIWWTN